MIRNHSLAVVCGMIYLISFRCRLSFDFCFISVQNAKLFALFGDDDDGGGGRIGDNNSLVRYCHCSNFQRTWKLLELVLATSSGELFFISSIVRVRADQD